MTSLEVYTYIEPKQVTYVCGLCGRHRRVRRYPVSNCSCMTGFPSRYMEWKFIIHDFYFWIAQHLKLLFKRKWRIKKA